MKDIVAAGTPARAEDRDEARAPAPADRDRTSVRAAADRDGTRAPADRDRTSVRAAADRDGTRAPAPADRDRTSVRAAELMGAVGAVSRTARRAARLAWWEEPLPPAQSELLRLAAARPGISVAEAAHELRLAPNTVSTLVGRLTAAELLDRERAASDGRSVRLTVTGKARQRMAGWRDLRAEVATRALGRLTAQDRAALADAVPALLRFAEELEREAP